VRSVPLTVLKSGIQRLRVKGGAAASSLYDLVNAYVTLAGTITPREGTTRIAALTSATVGLCAVDGVFNVFATSMQTVPAGFQCNLLVHPTNPSATLAKIWFAQPFMGFLYVVAQFNTGDIFHYWLQSGGTWQPNTVYQAGAIATPTVANGLAYQAVRDFPSQSTWAPSTAVALNQMVEPTVPTGYAYMAVAVVGTSPHTGTTEPTWPTAPGAKVYEYGDFDVTQTPPSSSSGPTAAPLATSITDRYGDSSEIAGQIGTADTTSLSGLTPAATVSTWSAGTLYQPGALVQPSTTQGAFVNAIPNGDFEAGDDGNWTKSSASVSIQSTNAYQGSNCVKFALAHAETATCTMSSYGVVTPGQSVTATAYVNPNNNGADTTMWLVLNWYDASDILLSSTPASTTTANGAEGFGYRQISVTGTAPAGAAHVRVQIKSATGTSPNPSYADLVSWNLETPTAVSQFIFEAVQGSAATSGSSEPAWPTVAGNTVVDGGVTWKAIGTSIITWQAIPLMLSASLKSIATFGAITGGSGYTNGTYDGVPLTGGSGSGATANITVSSGAVTAVALVTGGENYRVGDVLSASNAYLGGAGSGFSVPVATVTGGAGEPAWPTTVGVSVYDPSTFTSASGVVVQTGLSWVCINRQITDPKCPNSTAVTLGASHVFAGDKDIVPYSAAVNPTDWSTANNAGYLPSGLNNYGNNPVAALGLYRSNLVIFNSGGYQMWQIDPDPQNMALLDAKPVGSIWPRAIQAVANDLLFLAPVGVRNLAAAGPAASMQAGSMGEAIDPIVQARLTAGTYEAIGLYYPARGQYWLLFGPEALVLTTHGDGLESWSRYLFPDAITDWTLNGGALYLRTAGNLVWKFDPTALVDDAGGANVGFSGIVQWPYLDCGPIGINKMLIGLDLIGAGDVKVQIGFNQTDATSFSDNPGFATSPSVTAPYDVAIADTVPGQPIPIPVNAPSFSPVLTFSPNQAWSLEAATLYLADARGGGATG